MSLHEMDSQQHVRVSHVPAGGGPAYWVYSDLDTFKATGEDTGDTLTVVETVILPHAGPPPHIHHRENEFFYVLEGEMEVLDRDRKFPVGPGDFVNMPQGTLHAFRNSGDTDARILLLFAPAGFEKYLTEAGEAVAEHNRNAPTGETDLADAHRIAPRHGLEFGDAPPGVW
ncbi:cupin domain-containing protein [Streptomyces carminius]|uniref:Cupin domain-containing protein n=1 Tax=Streptomyces carminius TaxID=2665496 RepID=A0A2M8LR47_9ACTN|nr:cupin domain-containing protein [Streptomyces carminius]PJE94428.1 cupin domain-containing protein [Streptomyces carminius]